MKESTLRKFHRSLGITLAFFLLAQGGSGLLLSVASLLRPATDAAVTAPHHHALSEKDEDTHLEDEAAARHGVLGRIHHSRGPGWNLYRIAVGLGLMAMIGSGTTVFLLSRARTRRHRQKDRATTRANNL